MAKKYNVQVLTPEGRYLGEVADIEAPSGEDAEAVVRESLGLDAQPLARTWNIRIEGMFTFEFEYEDDDGFYEDADEVEDAVSNGDIDPESYGFDTGGTSDISIDNVDVTEE